MLCNVCSSHQGWTAGGGLGLVQGRRAGSRARFCGRRARGWEAPGRTAPRPAWAPGRAAPPNAAWGPETAGAPVCGGQGSRGVGGSGGGEAGGARAAFFGFHGRVLSISEEWPGRGAHRRVGGGAIGAAAPWLLGCGQAARSAGGQRCRARRADARTVFSCPGVQTLTTAV